MCGIHLTLSTEDHVLPNPRTCELLRRRGPDSARELKTTCTVAYNGEDRIIYITCYSTVLALRGEQTVSQPVTSPANGQSEAPQDFLCWNGEAWKLFNEPVAGNDSEAIFALLSKDLSISVDQHHGKPTIVDTMTAIKGPYAFVYYHSAEQKISFGRDSLGRRSLLSRFDERGNFCLTSVADASESGWQEVDADGLYSLDLSAFLDHASGQGLELSKSVSRLQITGSSPEIQACVGNTPDAEVLQASTHLTVSPQEDCVTPFRSLCVDSPSIGKLEELLQRSLYSRISTIPRRFHRHSIESPDTTATLAVLFSGGLDCTVLARMANDIVDINEPIDLLNVAFENPRVHKRRKDDAGAEGYSPYELCPDRITGRASFAELQQVCPHREWRFIAINIPYEETLAQRPEVVSLIHPHNTEMDLSIACALYFASRGSGLMFDADPDHSATAYTTEARVLLSGLGADELFGGYQRHELAYARKGSSGLLEELNLDVGRLGKRNLGRDDRVLSNWARETRFPFLDEDVVDWAIHTPVWERCDFGAPANSASAQTSDPSCCLESGKKVLRCLAWKLGMKKVASEKKRAIQFGARTAKMETGRSKGTQLLS